MPFVYIRSLLNWYRQYIVKKHKDNSFTFDQYEYFKSSNIPVPKSESTVSSNIIGIALSRNGCLA